MKAVRRFYLLSTLWVYFVGEIADGVRMNINHYQRTSSIEGSLGKIHK